MNFVKPPKLPIINPPSPINPNPKPAWSVSWIRGFNPDNCKHLRPSPPAMEVIDTAMVIDQIDSRIATSEAFVTGLW